MKKPTSGQTHHTATHIEWRGPLPPPQALSGYEDLIPGAAERLLRMTEEESAHRRAMERADAEREQHYISTHQRWMSRGQLFGFMISLAAVICGSITAVLGGDLTGLAAVIAGTGIMALGAIFGQRNR